MRYCQFVITFIFSLLMSTPSMASQAALQQFFAEVDSLQADFTQTVIDDSKMVLEQSSGRFYLSRPGKFRWDYSNPYADPIAQAQTESDLSAQASDERGLQIIADSKSIYMYDPDLEQVTQRSLEDALLQVPSLLLVQSGGSLMQHFNLTDIGLTDGIDWVLLKPKSEDASYQHLLIGFAGKQLQRITLLDGLGNETRLQLSNLINNAKISPQVFEFIAPAGTDIITQ